jgi:release factor glutamine methyltransferase
MESLTTIATEPNPPQLRASLIAGAKSLAAVGIPSARLDAEVLMGHVLGLTREQLLASADFPLSQVHLGLYRELLRRRLEREPIAYITGRQEFWSLELRVVPDVLIPRPETERLVEISLALARELPRTRSSRVLDIGTGSGAIAISLAKELPSALIWATDVSPAALEIARSNAAGNGVAARILFFHGDLFEAIGEFTGRFTLIVSNPPYIRSAEIDALEPEVSRWEPRGALDGGADGLDFYRRIARQARDYLAPNGAVAVEVAADMGKEVGRLFTAAGYYTGEAIVQDYAGRDRVVVARFAGKSANSA